MSITLFFGGIGSGKTAAVVRDICMDRTHRPVYSNIVTKKLSNNHVINRDMIIKKTVVGYKRNDDEIIKQEFNKEFWIKTIEEKKGISVVIDEAHTILNARRGMSKTAQCMTDFLALLRRVLGSTDSGYGELVMISQLERRIDIIAKEMCNLIKYFLCHYIKTCKNCMMSWFENNEMPEPYFECPRCASPDIYRHSFRIEVWHFRSVDLFVRWKYYGMETKKTAHRHYYINDIENYFPLYNSLQWDDLIS